MGETVSGRLPDDLVEGLQALQDATGRTRSEVLRQVVRSGLAQVRLKRGLEAYREGEASLGRASELAGLPVARFLDELQAAGIPRKYGPDEVAEDLDWAEDA